VQLEIPEREWLDIPLSRLQGVLRRIARLNWQPVLADARALPRRQFHRHLRMLMGMA